MVGIQRRFPKPFFVRFYDHACPQCAQRMEKVRCSTTIHAKSNAAKHFDFSFGDTSMAGDVKFIWDELRCPVCGKFISVEEMIRLERQNPRKGVHRISALSEINPFFIHCRRHHCPQCGQKLTVDYLREMISKKALDDDEKRFALSDIRFAYSVEVRRYLFHCLNCGLDISFGNMAKHENAPMA